MQYHRTTDDLSHKQSAGVLSPRELEVLRYFAGGYQPRHIALRLGIGLPAVQSHLRRATWSLGCITRDDSVRVASVRGLIPAPSIDSPTA
jgi:DNA-binding CsgD family transcriptional regulator